jgi:hypothetical protein
MRKSTFSLVSYLLVSSMLPTVCAATHAQLTLTGRIAWTDRRGPDEPLSAHPAREVLVELCDSTLPATNQVVDRTNTDDAGHYTITIPVGGPSQRSFFVRGRSESPAGQVLANGTTSTYILSSPVLTVTTTDGARQVNITGDYTTTTDAAFSVLDSLLGAQQFVSKIAKVNLPKIPVEFPTSGSASYFLDDHLYILMGDRWDWDVVMHEYGHYVSKSLHLDNSPGGLHYFDENIGDRLPKDQAIRLAWGEGWPTYFAITAQREMGMGALNIPNVGDAVYSDTEDASIEISLDSDGEGSLGEDNEVSVMRILYEAGTQRSGLSLSPSDIWADLTSAHPDSLSAGMMALQTRETVRQTLLLGVIAAKHKVAAALLTTPSGAVLPATPLTFSWNANGGGVKHPNNRFQLRFYDASMNQIYEGFTVPSGYLIGVEVQSGSNPPFQKSAFPP